MRGRFVWMPVCFTRVGHGEGHARRVPGSDKGASCFAARLFIAAPGEPRPQELQPESAARQALIGERQAEVRSEGERLLATKAGGDKADPLIRYVVDDDFGSLAHKDKGFADWVMFWRKGQPSTEPGLPAASGADTPAPVDAAAEAARVQSLTGNKPVIIARRTSSKIKLPGL